MAANALLVRWKITYPTARKAVVVDSLRPTYETHYDFPFDLTPELKAQFEAEVKTLYELSLKSATEHFMHMLNERSASTAKRFAVGKGTA